MPITNIASYVTTADAFLEHWTLVESVTGSAFTLQNGWGKDDLLDVRNDVDAYITEIQPATNARQIASNDLLTKRAELSGIVSTFNRTVRYRFRLSNYVPALPRVPSAGAGFGVFVRAVDDVSNLWTTINTNVPVFPGFTPPLLINSLTVAQFNTKVTALKTAFTTLTNKDQDLKLKREQRNAALPNLRSFLVLYRQAVLATFAPSNPLVLSLPQISPAPGSTPAAVQLSMSWNAALSKAVAEWTVSSDPNLMEYQLRACDPPKYKGEDEEVVTTITPPATSVQTDFGLLVSGGQKIFAVYVMTNTGNEKRSNVVKITRP